MDERLCQQASGGNSNRQPGQNKQDLHVWKTLDSRLSLLSLRRASWQRRMHSSACTKESNISHRSDTATFTPTDDFHVKVPSNIAKMPKAEPHVSVSVVQ